MVYDENSAQEAILPPRRRQKLVESTPAGRPAGAGAGLGAIVRERRKARRLTLRALAAAAECSASYLSQIENGERASPPREGVLERLERALGLAAGRLRREAEWERTPRAVK